MRQEIIFTPKQLYFMGRLMQARYIDYAYVAAMEDIHQNYALFESETRAELVSAGILMEDFGGNLEIQSTARSLLLPVFFGETETALEVCRLGDAELVHGKNFHFHDGNVTLVEGQAGRLVLRAVDQVYIHREVESLLGEDYCAQPQVVEEVDQTHITRIFACKRFCVGGDRGVKLYLECDGVVYQEREKGLESVTRAQFIQDVYDMVRGE